MRLEIQIFYLRRDPSLNGKFLVVVMLDVENEHEDMTHPMIAL